MRKYDDAVEVRRGREDDPEQFLWRGRLWKVRTVLAHWVETGPWWESSAVRAVVGTDDGRPQVDRRESAPPAPGADLLSERELWRVEAGRGSGDSGGVFDLSFSWDDGRWLLVGCAD